MTMNPIEVQKNLKGVRYPAGKDDLVTAAEANGADEELLGRLRSLEKDQFDSPADVMGALGGGES
jgi:Protein of unknown function (DUF2795)